MGAPGRVLELGLIGSLAKGCIFTILVFKSRLFRHRLGTGYDMGYKSITKKREAYRKYYRKHHEEEVKRSRKKYFKRKFNLDLKEVEDLINKCEGLCNICKIVLSKPCIDHDHKTGKIRGVLCPNCNAALGLFKDDPTLLKEAIKYLK